MLPRTLGSSMDFKLIYVASAAWAQGLDPYDNKILDNLWVERGNSITTAPGLASLYPITTYAMLSPLSMLSWENAKLIWLFINICACLLIWAGMVKILKINITDWPSIVLLVALLALVPVQNCIFQGQPVLVVLSLLVFSILFFIDGSDLFSGAFLGLALGLKPQIGLFLLVYYLIKRPLEDRHFDSHHHAYSRFFGNRQVGFRRYVVVVNLAKKNPGNFFSN